MAFDAGEAGFEVEDVLREAERGDAASLGGGGEGAEGCCCAVTGRGVSTYVLELGLSFKLRGRKREGT